MFFCDFTLSGDLLWLLFLQDLELLKANTVGRLSVCDFLQSKYKNKVIINSCSC